MTATTLHPAPTRAVRPHGISAVAGGMVLLVLGLSAALNPDIGGTAWFVTAAAAALLFVVGILGMRRAAADAAPRLVGRALAVAAGAMTLFAAAHLYTLVNEDLAILLFSIFMVVAAAGLIVAGVGMLRARALGLPQRVVVLLAGVWPIATIPAGGALGDVTRFAAIAVWGVCWIAFGATLLTVRR